jgi:hypothetical protein
MRNLRIELESGQELFEAYWNFLRSGGLILPRGDGLDDGEAIELVVRIRSLKKEWRLRSRVVRVGEDGRAHVAFEDGQDQEAMVNAAWADSYDVPERKHQRHDLRADVSISSPSGGDRRATLTNLSRGGCRIETNERLPVGTRLRLFGAGLDADAQVRWARTGGELGLEFAQPLASVALP